MEITLPITVNHSENKDRSETALSCFSSDVFISSC